MTHHVYTQQRGRKSYSIWTALSRKYTLPPRKPYGLTSRKTSFLHFNNHFLLIELQIPPSLIIWEEGGSMTSWRRVRIVYRLSVRGSLMAQDVHTVNTLNLCTLRSRNTRTVPNRCENILWQPLALWRLGKTLAAGLLFLRPATLELPPISEHGAAWRASEPTMLMLAQLPSSLFQLKRRRVSVCCL